MFAVPGWALSASDLTPEKLLRAAASSGAKSRKRKRGLASDEVTASNVAGLYKTVVERKLPDKPPKGTKQKRKSKSDSSRHAERKRDEKPRRHKERSPGQPSKPLAGNDSNGGNNPRPKNHQPQDANDTALAEPQSATSTQKPMPAANSSGAGPALPRKPAQLTPLQAAMREKLVSARFRHLNETLYTRPSREAFQLFAESPEMFDEYHEGFRRQVKVWPENPVDSFLRDIRSRARPRSMPKHKHSASSQPMATAPLPRTDGSCTIADLGCGDARLAEALQADKAKLKINILSYDLQSPSPSPLVTKADIAALPLADGSINVAVFCLALMSTNWLELIEEAYRILHWKGELWVAEIKSRFGPVRNKHTPVEHSVGKHRKAGVGKSRPSRNEDRDRAGHDKDLAVEVDGAEDRRRETDVSAFIDALRLRGFVLRGDRSEAVDLSNKMFVKMNFIKGVAPTVGKHAGARHQPSKAKKGFAPSRDEVDEETMTAASEAAILKPCVYKTR